MKPLLLFILCSFVLASGRAALGQAADDATAEPQAAAGSTIITSNELHSDQSTHVSIFTGKVIVTGTNFRMTCEEMTVNFTKDNKVDTIVATGDVVITQPDRITHCGRAEYFHDDDKFVLTDQPTIHDHNDDLSGTQIVIYRTSQKMEVTGGRTQMIIAPGAMGTAKETTPGETK